MILHVVKTNPNTAVFFGNDLPIYSYTRHDDGIRRRRLYDANNNNTSALARPPKYRGSSARLTFATNLLLLLCRARADRVCR